MIDQFPMYKLRVWGDIYAFPLIFVIISTLLYQHNYLRDICLPKLRVKTLGITVYTSTQKFGTHVQHYEHKDYLSNHIKSGGQIVHPPTSRGCNSLSKFPSEHPGEKNVTSYLDVPGAFKNVQNVYVGRVCLVYGNLSITHWRIAICLGTVKFPVTSHSCYFSHTYK
jgi:hypothetical protein